ncbi:HNH endonuclease signature motif containing protein [Knoellia sp. Soil729]|uniref:HNH endonuclease signature motif containing protein n=1 Tax=Knoellia sp. Soil729 TaxID=1736394 RepID=UPI0006F6F575|nr:HNH endonuclease signature motif containing protein [Knoellia sp. Soil729]KRE42726.1 hypothetical protein ASG74_10140 [Knoellia sp. Soil729]
MDNASATPVAQLRVALEGARDALASSADGAGVVGDALARLSGGELAEFMTLADEVKARAGAAQVRLTAEAAHRGEFTSARRGQGSVHEWVREHAPSLRQGGAGLVAQLGQDVAASAPAGLWGCAGPQAGAYADAARPEGIVWARLVTGEVAPALAVTALREMSRLEELLEPEAVPTVAKAILDFGVQWGARDAKKIRTRLIAQFGRQDEFDDLQDRLRSGAHLSSPTVADGDLTTYDLALTPQQSAALEAAIGPLSRPAPNEVTGERDLRPAGQRRAEALAALCARVAAQDAGDASPGGAPTTMHVQVGLEDLLGFFPATESDTATGTSGRTDADAGTDTGAGGRTGCGRVMLTRAQATILAPTTVRQLACDADIIPVVLGSHGEILNLGRAVRLFTRAQRRALWHRDGGCTYPGCDAPAAWTQAHHLVHWVDGGPSDLAYAALLCQRHHTHVHDQRLTATVHPPDEQGRSVTWDLTPGSYDRDLPGLLTAIHRARAQKYAAATAAQARAAERAHLDTGPPDPWLHEPSDDLIEHWVEQWMADHDAAEREAALEQDELDDALSAVLA